MKKFMKENYLNSNIKLNRFNGFLSVIKKDVNYEGKYFIASTLNELILQDKKIINISIDKDRYFTFYSHAKINEYERIKNA
ncbi:hypothetical protein [Campylobacter jejuni]|uniref:hypothetical protein n=1 Tax=Campylobacter jejuni TaxID=197 RepID=UPI003CF596AE